MAVPYNSNFDSTHPFSDVGGKMLLAANAALTFTVPGTSAQKYRATFSFNENDYVWVAKNQTAVGPTIGVVADTNQQEMRPGPRYVIGGDTLSFITSQTGVQVGVSLLALPNDR